MNAGLTSVTAGNITLNDADNNFGMSLLFLMELSITNSSIKIDALTQDDNAVGDITLTSTNGSITDDGIANTGTGDLILNATGGGITLDSVGNDLNVTLIFQLLVAEQQRLRLLLLQPIS